MDIPLIKTSLKIIFMGTPEFANVALKAIFKNNFNVTACYSGSPKPRGRGHKTIPTPVNLTAKHYGIDTYTPTTLRNEVIMAQFQDLKPDVVVVAAYGLIIPEDMLAIPKYGFINIHGSLLPRWRGAAPIQRCIEHGDAKTGITIMKMDKGLDTGEMIMWDEIPITQNDNSSIIHDKLADMGAHLIVKTLHKLYKNGHLPSIPQDNSQATYAHKLEKDEAIIDWDQDCQTIIDKIRAFNPWPLCQAKLGDRNIKILKVKTAEGKFHNLASGEVIMQEGRIIIGCGDHNGNYFDAIEILQLKPENKGAMSASDFLNGLGSSNIK